ncbi:ABC transporter permease [Thermomonospora cellulosilytica]|uniref:NitT/TauT family transport system permease protein/taurine transport system permease protein n=1 Tax=Thermomonospora cellulosilytica TaxID=1411118 RepID=A0A7W3MVJ6_9ACTN|nr:ABC transporter permease [Thermomonospora cellulosilytica]MBA9002632.1 NitT/TauT family transport system permease protein/taurine transport system permease protein [Thermomonospora cellulosilytica]
MTVTEAPEAVVTAGPARRRRSRRRARMGALALTLTAAVWQIAAMVIGDTVTLPTVPETARTFVTYLTKPYPEVQGKTLVEDALISTGRILAGFVLGTLAGLLLGAAMAGVRAIRELADPIIEVVRPLPPIAFIPLLVVWLGIGEPAKIALIFFGVLPVVTIATLGALDAVPAELLHASRSLGASPAYTMLHVRLRAAVPGVITGLRIAMGGAWTSIIAAEMIAATGGVGHLILQAGNYLQTPLIFCGIAEIAVLGLAFDGLLRLLLRLADPTVRR